MPPLAKPGSLVKVTRSRYVSTVMVTINGEERKISAELSLAQLLRDMGLPASRVAVEVNREVVPRTEFAAKLLAEGDKVEVVHFVGGGR